MKNVFLETQNVQAFRAALAALEDVEKGQPGLGVVWGRAGRGKTLCAREYAVRTGAVYLRVLENWTQRGMLSQLCREINGTEPTTTDRCKSVACAELDRIPRTILVDEADRLHVGRVEDFRDIHDLTGVPVVLIGEEHLYAVLSARGRLWSRVMHVVEFGPIGAEDVMLYGLKAADLKVVPAAAQRIVARSGGDFRLVFLDMHDLDDMARANQVREITVEMVDMLPPRKPGPGGPRGRAGKNGGAHGGKGK